MLKPYEMSSVIITGTNDVQEAIIKELHKLKILHIVEHSQNELADIGKPLESANRLSEVLVKVRALITALKIRKEENKFESKSNLLEIESTTKKLSQEVNASFDELKKTEELISKNEALKQELEILKDINIPIEYLTSYKSLAYFIGYVKDEDKVTTLKEELSKITEKFMLRSSIVKKNSLILLFIDIKNKEHSSDILHKAGFSPISFTNISSLKGTAESNLKKIGEETAKLTKKRDELKKRIERLSQEYKGFLIAADEFLSEQLEKAEAPLKFASTPSSFLIKGWIPTAELSTSINRLNKVSKNKIFIHFEPAKKNAKVPIKLKNSRYVKPFEFFIDLYTMPNYKEIDPTFFVFLTFPILFGIMLGDIGYGIFSLLFFLALKRKMPKARNFLNIMLIAAFATILFGFLFGEFFGYEFIHPIVSREHDMFKLLYIAIAVGIVHVNIGLIIGFFNELISHGIIHAIYAKASWIILQIGITLLALSYFDKIALSPLIGAVFLGASILMLFKGEGVKGLIEIPSIFTNILSYARLMAIGLSSVILAVIINDSAREFFHQGGFFVLIGILILIVGHSVNIMLGLLASFLHSLRLHYVEFFSKFFHGGAEKYKPFGMKES